MPRKASAAAASAALEAYARPPALLVPPIRGIGKPDAGRFFSSAVFTADFQLISVFGCAGVGAVRDLGWRGVLGERLMAVPG